MWNTRVFTHWMIMNGRSFCKWYNNRILIKQIYFEFPFIVIPSHAPFLSLEIFIDTYQRLRSMFGWRISFSPCAQVRWLWFRSQLIIPFRHLDIQDSPYIVLAIRCSRRHRHFANLLLHIRIMEIMFKTAVVNAIVGKGRPLNTLEGFPCRIAYCRRRGTGQHINSIQPPR